MERGTGNGSSITTPKSLFLNFITAYKFTAGFPFSAPLRHSCISEQNQGYKKSEDWWGRRWAIWQGVTAAILQALQHTKIRANRPSGTARLFYNRACTERSKPCDSRVRPGLYWMTGWMYWASEVKWQLKGWCSPSKIISSLWFR